MNIPIKYVDIEYRIFVRIGKLIKEIERYDNSL